MLPSIPSGTVLSIQGGGIRGIIPCCHLVELERQMGGLARDHIDMVAGTSTGALLAACIAQGVPATEALKTYTEQGARIFSPGSDLLRKANLVLKGREFDNQLLARAVKATLPRPAMTLIESPVRILITAVAMDGTRWYFVRPGADNSKLTGACTLADCAIASACATTYHDPWPIPGFGYFFDGGTGGLCDPVYHAAVEAFDYDCFIPENTRIISLGTGYTTPGASQPPPPKGLLENISWVIDSLLGASKTEAEQAVDRHWPGVLISLNSILPRDIDEADVNSIPDLVSIGEKAAAVVDWKKLLDA